jgi:hypothetical protein
MMPLSTAATFHNAPVRECRRVNRIAVLFAALHMSAYGTSRHFTAPQQFGRFQTEADISRVYENTA